MRVRRRLVALVSTVLMLTIGAGVIGMLVMATQGERGRDWLRRALQAQLSRSLQGTVYLGTLSGSFLTDLRADSLEIRDMDDSVFVATGPIRVTFDPRDLIDGRIILRTADIARPLVYMRRDSTEAWSHNKIWPRRSGLRGVRRPRSAFGSVIVIEQAVVDDGEFVLMQPWEPDDSLTGVRRDSAARAALADPRRDIRRAGRDRYVRTWRWQQLGLELPRTRLAYPDSAGRVFDIRRLDVVESDPPFAFRNVAGSMLWVGDSIWLDLQHFDLPGSTGRASGRIEWGSDLPVRYAIRVQGDSVSLADVSWINPAIPTEGSGRMVLDIRNATGDLDILEYAITAMDVRAHRSRLRGRMTWGVGGPVTRLTEVDLEASPLDFALIERFNQGPFPFPFRGTFTGRVRARGGPLHRFSVDDASVTFADGNVPGVRTQVKASGVLDVLFPALTRFRGLELVLQGLDLRTLQALNPEFPRLNGTLSGTATLDSTWLDVRLREADITHRDGEAPVSRLLGSARIDSRGEELAYELEAATLPLSFTALAQSYPGIPLRGEYSGPLRVNGRLSDLFVVADLVGPGGRVETDLRLDALAPRYRVTGRAALSTVDPSVAMQDDRAPSGELNARVALDVAGDSLGGLEGSATLDVERSVLDGVRIFAGVGRLRFENGRAVLDTLDLESSALDLSAVGALGLHAAARDSVQVRAVVDSLGGLRRWLADQGTDSLAGRVAVRGTARGWLRGFALSATADGDGLLWRGNTMQRLAAVAELQGLPAAPRGELAVRADSFGTTGLSFDRASAVALIDHDGGIDLRADGSGTRGTVARASARILPGGDTLRVRLDTLTVVTDASRWTLAAPTFVMRTPEGIRLDSLLLRAGRDTLLRVAGETPRDSGRGLRLTARSLPLADVAELLQLADSAEGTLDLDAELRGTRERPQIEGSGTLRGALVQGIRLDTLRFTGRSAPDQLRVTAQLGAQRAPAVSADLTLPLRLGAAGGATEWIDEGPLDGRIRADSLPFRLFESLTRGAVGNGGRPVPGTVAFDIALGGTWARPTLDGRLTARDGALSLPQLGHPRWRNVRADIAFRGDSIVVDSITATTSEDGRSGRATLAGWLSYRDRDDPRLDLRLDSRTFHALARPDLADMDISGTMRLSGARSDATLRGDLTADRAIISIPTLTSKDVISLEDPDRFGAVDTLVMLDDRRLRVGPPAALENLTVENVPFRMGREVWLRSSEANVNLGGSVNITRGRVTRGRDAGQYQLALDGTLQTVRGTYRLNLGPVQRTFEVQSGNISFFGDPDLNPSLDITGLHTVRQYSQQGARPDVRVLVHIGGTLLSPTAELSTPDSVRVTNADLISYLVTGGPSYEIGSSAGGAYTGTAARVLLSSIGSFLGGKATGNLCDDAQVSTAGVDEIGGGLRDVGGSILSGTRFSCAKQLTDRAYVRLDAGLCQVGQLVSQGGGSPLNLDAFGVKFDYLLGRDLTASAGVEPPTSAVLCAQNASARGFAPTPQQIGLDVFRSWRF